MPNKHATLEALFSDMADKIRAKKGTSGTIIADNIPSEIETITSGIEPANETYDQRNDQVRSFLGENAYDPSDYTESDIHSSANPSGYANYGYNAYPQYTKPASVSITLPVGTLIVADASGRVFTQTISAAGTQTIKNLTPGVAQYVVVNAGTVVACGCITANGAVRMIDADNIPNVRDIGGWACDSGTVKYNMIFRGGILAPSATALSVFRNIMRIKTEISLVQSSAAASPFGDDVKCIWFPENSNSVSPWWYRSIFNTERAPDRIIKTLFTEIFESVIRGDPVYVHCAEGADRTGTICFILEALLGLSQSDMDRDYEMTSFSTGADNDSHARRRNETQWYDPTASHTGTADLGLVSGFVELSGSSLRDKVALWLVKKGVSLNLINAYRRAMIDVTAGSTLQDIDLGLTDFTVTNTLTNATSDNAALSVEPYQPYVAKITAASGNKITATTVTLGGADVTASVLSPVYNSGGEVESVEINIENVYGNLAISVVGGTAREITTLSAVYTGGSLLVGDTEIDTSDLIVTADYSDGSTETVTSGYTVAPFEIIAGTNTLTVAYSGKTATCTVTGSTETGNLFDMSAEGFADNSKISSGATTTGYIAADTSNKQFVTNYIPIKNGQTIKIAIPTMPGTSTASFSNTTGTYALFYDSGRSLIGGTYKNISNEGGTIASGYFTWTISNTSIAYVRLSPYKKISAGAVFSNDGGTTPAIDIRVSVA